LVTELIVLLGSIASGITTSFDGKNRKKKVFLWTIYIAEQKLQTDPIRYQ